VGERTEYAPGTFCWVDLGTTDVDGAAAFYAAVLGWEASPLDEPQAGGYRLMLVGGRTVSGIYPGAGDAPPAWLSYVSVEQSEATAARATELGATVALGPMDVLEHGRTTLLIDPQGAHVALWEPRAHAGAGLVNDPGALTLNQLNTHDVAGSTAFYTALFGWEISQVADDPSPYWGIENQGRLNGGVMGLPPGNPAPPHWLPYFTVEDIDAADAGIVDAGGAVIVPVMPAGPQGRILVGMDPQGAAFALFEGRVDP
jgi:predicted enzyme related to lactoylglutathione lyase